MFDRNQPGLRLAGESTQVEPQIPDPRKVSGLVVLVDSSRLVWRGPAVEGLQIAGDPRNMVPGCVWA